jgi:excinuclease ABC subunit C
VVFNRDGPLKSDYRRFNIENVAAGDDYAAMRQVLMRRYSRLQREQGKLPDLVLIDGGAGQVRQAIEVMQELQISECLVVGVAKGPSRKAGLETLVLEAGNEALHAAPESPALHLIQQIRDEAHRFAITGHRQRRAKARRRSNLEDIEGVGSKRRQQLIRYFGGLQSVARAGIDDLSKVPGISRLLAEKIYNYFREGP